MVTDSSGKVCSIYDQLYLYSTFKTQFTKCSDNPDKAGNSIIQCYRINTQQSSQAQGSLM